MRAVCFSTIKESDKPDGFWRNVQKVKACCRTKGVYFGEEPGG
jgi:hypothetical protein